MSRPAALAGLVACTATKHDHPGFGKFSYRICGDSKGAHLLVKGGLLRGGGEPRSLILVYSDHIHSALLKSGESDVWRVVPQLAVSIFLTFSRFLYLIPSVSQDR